MDEFFFDYLNLFEYSLSAVMPWGMFGASPPLTVAQWTGVDILAIRPLHLEKGCLILCSESRDMALAGLIQPIQNTAQFTDREVI